MRSQHLAAGFVVLCAVGAWHVRAGQVPGAKAEERQDAADLLRHGEYLVNSASMCGDCHTPRDGQGQPDKAKMLQGATLPIRPKDEDAEWMDEAPDITGGGLAGEWGEEAMAKFLMTGVDPQGAMAMAPMPSFRLNARDARAVARYLKSLGEPKAGKP